MCILQIPLQHLVVYLIYVIILAVICDHRSLATVELILVGEMGI